MSSGWTWTLALLVACAGLAVCGAEGPAADEHGSWEPPALLSAEEEAETLAQIDGMWEWAFGAYERRAYGFDELQPLSCAGSNRMGGLATTLVDSLDSLIVFGKRDAFNRAVAWLETEGPLRSEALLDEKTVLVSPFETNIRVVGGLLSGHLICDQAAAFGVDCGSPYNGHLLEQAERVARRLLLAFASPQGFPYAQAYLNNGSFAAGGVAYVSVAEAGTYHLEFCLLSELTGDDVFCETAKNVAQRVYDRRSAHDLLGTNLHVVKEAWTLDLMSIGAGVDSFIESLLKHALMWKDRHSRTMFLRLYKAVMRHARRGPFYFQVNMNTGQLSAPWLEGLVAFWPGMQCLLESPAELRHARRTLETMVAIAQQHDHFFPEIYDFQADELVDPRYYLRPEMAESLYWLHRTTQDPIYRLLARDMINAIDVHCRARCGFAGLRGVKGKSKMNRMESFFFAETLKYFRLLFDDGPLLGGVVPAKDIFFTTEGHMIWRTPSSPASPAGNHHEL